MLLIARNYESPLIRVLLLGRAHFDSRDYRPSLKRVPFSLVAVLYILRGPVSRRSILSRLHSCRQLFAVSPNLHFLLARSVCLLMSCHQRARFTRAVRVLSPHLFVRNLKLRPMRRQESTTGCSTLLSSLIVSLASESCSFRRSYGLTHGSSRS